MLLPPTVTRPFQSATPPLAPSRLKQWGRGSQCSATSKLTSPQSPRASPLSHREASPVLFSCPDQCPSVNASDLVFFGGSEDEDPDDSMSLAASDAEELSRSSHDPTPLPSKDPIAAGSVWMLSSSASFQKPSRSWSWSGLHQRSPLTAAWMNGSCRGADWPLVKGCLHTIGVIGPIFGYSLGSLCASLYVDIGLVSQESVTITPQDSRWVGAWWLGYVVSGLLTLLAALPLWFLPRAENPQTPELDHPSNQHKHTLSITEIAKDFGPSLKHLFTNGIYLLYLVYSVLAFNAFTILVTYTPKYLEQQFGQSASKTNFLIGVTFIPAVALGMFLSGWIMKRFKLGLLGSARLMFFTSVISLVCTIPYFALSCENVDVAGVTVSYQRSIVQDARHDLLTSCNADCGCPNFQWDPVCGQNGVTYISSCHAGCNSTRGTGQNMTFHGCTCIQSWGLTSENSSAVLGQCSRGNSCTKMFYIYLALQSLAFFVYSLGTVPFFLISLRIVDPALKSLSVGIFLLVLRVFGGIPAPICFGALIDTTCLKWGQKKCGGSGACRMYDIVTFR
ncbi:hypothetical protein Q8A67_012569 [Cirrhinus molitorella]|uniref:Solute carrier organic anion transporter family member n=1 Tax=Cirrhinus molitorella TaxID=172907 RepID=A0AA88PJS3_9TELE|nr:hypothetical protein Q8A67_012569 [Cirrhinus molitorella]